MVGFSQNLAILMKERGISSYKLAKGVGVHISTVTNWLNGSSPKVDSLQHLSQYFKVSVDKLIKDK